MQLAKVMTCTVGADCCVGAKDHVQESKSLESEMMGMTTIKLVLCLSLSVTHSQDPDVQQNQACQN